MSFLNTILDIVFPVNCVLCNKAGKDLCAECISDFRQAERESEEWIFPLYDYRDPRIKKTIWLLKYKGRKNLAGNFAEVLYGRIIEELADLSILENFKDPILVPIPLSKERYRERKYNQAELMCKGLVKLDLEKNFKLEKDVLIKTIETEHQARIENRNKRQKNIIGSFSVINTPLIKGRNIILIDDVTTTGATLREAKKVLKQAGVKKVIAFTVAH